MVWVFYPSQNGRIKMAVTKPQRMCFNCWDHKQTPNRKKQYCDCSQTGALQSSSTLPSSRGSVSDVLRRVTPRVLDAYIQTSTTREQPQPDSRPPTPTYRTFPEETPVTSSDYFEQAAQAELSWRVMQPSWSGGSQRS